MSNWGGHRPGAGQLPGIKSLLDHGTLEDRRAMLKEIHNWEKPLNAYAKDWLDDPKVSLSIKFQIWAKLLNKVLPDLLARETQHKGDPTAVDQIITFNLPKLNTQTAPDIEGILDPEGGESHTRIDMLTDKIKQLEDQLRQCKDLIQELA